jgi:hypothetical protein
MPLEDADLEESGIRPEPGSIVLFYTDGLVERRGVPLDEGIDRLARAFERADGDLDAVADSVLAEMLRDSAREDDTCLLMFRIGPRPEDPRGQDLSQGPRPSQQAAGLCDRRWSDDEDAVTGDP